MRSGGLVNKLLRNSEGGVLVEFTLVFPVLLAVALGTVDFAYLLFDYSMANKAAFQGARQAVVINPVASGITSSNIYTAAEMGFLGEPCLVSTTGNPSPDNNCPTISTTCTAASSNGTCTGGYTWNETAFTNPSATNAWQKGIFDRMQQVFPRLQRQNVQIVYATNGLGFTGRPGGLPMNVTVSITGMTHQFYFIGALARITSLRTMPAFATTLTSECMDNTTANNPCGV